MNLAFTHNSKLAKKEPGWGAVDKTKLPHAAFARQGEPDKKSTWGFPHHWVQNGGGEDSNGVYTTGTMYLHRGGLGAAWAAANGGRSGKRAEPAVLAHLRKHYADLGIKPAALARISAELGLELDIDKLDAELLAAGVLTAEDLVDDLYARISLWIQNHEEGP